MANPHRGAVALETDGKVYSLRFTTNSICELEEHFGQPIAKIVTELQDESNASMKMVRAVVWGALLSEQPDITLKDAGNLLDEVGVDALTEKLGLALQRFFPDAEAGEKKNPPKAKAA